MRILTAAMPWHILTSGIVTGALATWLYEIYQKQLSEAEAHIQQLQGPHAQFSDLAAELRQMIYHSLIPSYPPEKWIHPNEMLNGHPNVVKATRVNKEMRYELLSRFYDDKLLVWSPLNSLTRFSYRDHRKGFSEHLKHVRRFLFISPAIAKAAMHNVRPSWTIRCMPSVLIYLDCAQYDFEDSQYQRDAAKVVAGDIVVKYTRGDEGGEGWHPALKDHLDTVMEELQLRLRRDGNQHYLDAEGYWGLVEIVYALYMAMPIPANLNP